MVFGCTKYNELLFAFSSTGSIWLLVDSSLLVLYWSFTSTCFEMILYWNCFQNFGFKGFRLRVNLEKCFECTKVILNINFIMYMKNFILLSWTKDYCFLYDRRKKICVVWWYDVVVVYVVVCVIVVRRHIWFPDNNLSISQWISMKFNKLRSIPQKEGWDWF